MALRTIDRAKIWILIEAAMDPGYFDYDQFAAAVGNAFRESTPVELRRIELRVLRELLEDGLIRIGDSPYLNSNGTLRTSTAAVETSATKSRPQESHHSQATEPDRAPWQIAQAKNDAVTLALGFHPWSVTPNEAIDRVRHRLNELGRDPDKFEVAAFTTTERGMRLVWRAEPEWVERIICAR